MDRKLELNYFYGTEAESFTFYRIPKLLITDDIFKNLSSDAKILYGLMLDRMSISKKNGWFDANKRVYIYYSIEDVMENLNCSKNKALKSLQELDGENGIGLIERVKQGQGKPTIVYVKNFFAEKEVSDSQNLGIKNPIICDSRISKNGNQEVQNMNHNKNYINNINFNNNKSNLIISDDEIGCDVNTYMDLIRDNLELECMYQRYPLERELIEDIFELIVETVVSKGKTIIIASNEYPMELVRSKFLKLNSGHIEYVMSCMKSNTSRVRNIKKYMLATLFNAPTTYNSYFQAEVNADFPQYAKAK